MEFALLLFYCFLKIPTKNPRKNPRVFICFSADDYSSVMPAIA